MDNTVINSLPQNLIFNEGILGFEDIKEYNLLFTEEDAPFFYLQASNQEHPCFIVCEPFSFFPDYNVNFTSEIADCLKAQDERDLGFLIIATIPENIYDATVNLKSPIIYNKRNKLAKQFVLDIKEYPIRYKLFGNIEVME